MGRTVVVPLDGTARAESAVPYAVELAAASGSVLHFVRVHPAPPAAGGYAWIQEHRRSRDAAAAYLDGAVDSLRRELGPAAVDATLVEDEATVADGIRRVAEAVGAGMVVLATRAPAAVERDPPASVAEDLIRHAACPVVLVTERIALRGEWSPRHLLVPLPDLTDAFLLDRLAELGHRLASEITLLSVLDPEDPAQSVERRPWTVPGSAPALAAAHDLLRARDAVHRDLPDHPVHTRLKVNPCTAREILWAARDVEADMILVPSNLQRPAIRDLVDGSHVPVGILAAGSGGLRPPAGEERGRQLQVA